MKRIIKFVGVTLAALAGVAAALYIVGVRIYLDGGGSPHFTRSESSASRAAIIEQHREAQRAAIAAAETAAPSPAPGASADAGARGSALPAGAPSAVAASPGEWTDFRGPNRDGHYPERPILTTWPAAGLTPLWKQPVGEGYASFAVAGGRAFTIEQRGAREVVAAYDVSTGRELWTNSWTAAFRESMGGNGPRSTPTWADGLVYALGGQGELRCLDATTGRVVWRTNILEDAGASNLQWGMAASPLIVDDTVVVLPGGPSASIVAYRAKTGARAWSALNDQAGYASPMLVTLAGVRQLLVFSGSRLMGVVPGTGAVLWEYPWATQYGVNAAQPIVVSNSADAARVFISSGYGTGAAVVELTRAGDRLSTREVWRNIRMKNQFTSSVLHDGFIYGLDESILACIDADTGALKWKGGRYGYGQVILASGHLIVLTEDGDLVLVRATPDQHEEVARSRAIEGKTWNHPSMANGRLLVRNLREMAAFDLNKK